MTRTSRSKGAAIVDFTHAGAAPQRRVPAAAGTRFPPLVSEGLDDDSANVLRGNDEAIAHLRDGFIPHPRDFLAHEPPWRVEMTPQRPARRVAGLASLSPCAAGLWFAPNPRKGGMTTVEGSTSFRWKEVEVSPDRVKGIQRGLREVGFPIAVDGILGPRTHAAIHEFKRGWAFRTPPLRRSSSKPGRGFRLALRRSLRRNGACSRHFRYLEFASHGNHWIRLHYKLVRAAERLRRRVGPIAILSGYRDPAHNRAVGGAANSQHLYGCAFDPTRPLPRARVPGCGFSGIGLDADGVQHLDVRHVCGHNASGGTPKHPTVFRE